ncbi:MAG: DNA primase [Chitinispirillaceae bacterium]|nr:DNA primase [Chitinispirillaceae bacterium]
MPPFNDNAKEEVRCRVDIVSVIGRYVTLKPSGRTLKGLCPFHQEKTPSFHVNPVQGFFHCFGCGKGGDVFTFIQEIEGIGFAEALAMLADECGVTLQRSPPQLASGAETADAPRPADTYSKTELLRIHEVAARFFYNNIKPAAAAVAYLKSRGLQPETVRDFRLGFAPAGWTALIDHCASERIPEPSLVACGLAIRKEHGGCYDRFRNRLMFSLCDLSGRVIGFAGRGMEKDAEPKYLNSPETTLYKKKFFLYGLDRARAAIAEHRTVIVVEGYMDYLTLFQAGIRNIVATSGTALTPEHARLLGRFARSIVLTFDGDSAGQAAAEKAVATLAPFNFDLSILMLPEDEDPDSTVKNHGRRAFEEFLDKRQPWEGFIIERMMAAHDAVTARGKSAVIDACAPLVKSLSDPIMVRHFKRMLAERLGIEERLVYRKLPDGKGHAVAFRPSILSDDLAYSTSLEGKFLHYLFLKPELIEEARSYVAPETLTDGISGDIYSLMLSTYDRECHLNNVANHTDDPEIRRLISLLQVKEDTQEHIHEEFVQKIIHLRRKYLHLRVEECTLRMKNEPHRRNELLKLQHDYTMQLKELDKEE